MFFRVGVDADVERLLVTLADSGGDQLSVLISIVGVTQAFQELNEVVGWHEKVSHFFNRAGTSSRLILEVEFMEDFSSSKYLRYSVLKLDILRKSCGSVQLRHSSYYSGVNSPNVLSSWSEEGALRSDSDGYGLSGSLLATMSSSLELERPSFYWIAGW